MVFAKDAGVLLQKLLEEKFREIADLVGRLRGMVEESLLEE